MEQFGRVVYTNDISVNGNNHEVICVFRHLLPGLQPRENVNVVSEEFEEATTTLVMSRPMAESVRNVLNDVLSQLQTNDKAN